MQAEGLKPLFPFAPFNVMGFVEVAGHLGFFWKVERQLKSFSRKKSLILLSRVDYPGFNLRIAKMVDDLYPCAIYICPQFWAWKHNRVYKLKENVRQVACILPFEKNCWKCTYICNLCGTSHS